MESRKIADGLYTTTVCTCPVTCTLEAARAIAAALGTPLEVDGTQDNEPPELLIALVMSLNAWHEANEWKETMRIHHARQIRMEKEREEARKKRG